MNELSRVALAEGIGTFAVTFVSSAAVCADAYSGGELGVLGIAAAYGLIVAAVVTALGHLSGGHVNPAVTLAAVLTRAMEPARAAVFVAAQLVGAVVAGLLLASLFSAEVWGPVQLGTPMPGPGVTGGTATFLEMVMTFLLVLVVLQMALDDRAPRHVHGLVIGATLGACALLGGPVTGAAMNPARAFGPALAAGEWSSQIVYWIGPALGAVLAAVAHALLTSDPARAARVEGRVADPATPGRSAEDAAMEDRA